MQRGCTSTGTRHHARDPKAWSISGNTQGSAFHARATGRYGFARHLRDISTGFDVSKIKKYRPRANDRQALLQLSSLF